MAEVNQQDKRKIKMINGWKVNHPFSFGNILYSFTILLFIALPLSLFFLPLVRFPQETSISLNGLTIFQYFTSIEFWKAFIAQESLDMPVSMGYFVSLFGDNEVSLQVVMYILLAQTALIMILLVNSVVLVVFFLISIIKGYLRRSRKVKVFMVFDFIFTLIFSLSFLVFHFMLMLTEYKDYIWIWYSLIPAAIALVLLIFANIVRNSVYGHCVFEADLEYRDDEDKEVVTEVATVTEVKKTTYEVSNQLPPGLTTIGGHAFSENQNLEIANIPLEVSKLGAGAFANCLNLKVVSLPDGIKEIGFNCFFNCASLERISYAGTKEQWRHIKRGSNWLAKAKTTEVVCVDGPIVVNPYH